MMDRLHMCPGRVVLSTQGRDEGRYFIVLTVLDENYVMMADGLTRKIAHAKKKKIKHLRMKPIVVNVDGATLPNHHLQDSDLRHALSVHGLEIENAPAIAGENSKVGNVPTKKED